MEDCREGIWGIYRKRDGKKANWKLKRGGGGGGHTQI